MQRLLKFFKIFLIQILGLRHTGASISKTLAWKRSRTRGNIFQYFFLMMGMRSGYKADRKVLGDKNHARVIG